MGFWSKAGNAVKKVGNAGVRVGTAWVSGGGSELYRNRAKKADPVTAKGEQVVDYAGNKVAEVGGADGSTNNASTAETLDEKNRRQALEANADADLESARKYRDKLAGEPGALPREAPQVTAPGAITPAQAAAPGQISSSLDTTNSDKARQAYQDYIDRQRLIAEGKGGPSAAELAMRRGNAAAIRSQYALASGARGYSQQALRTAQDNVAGLQQQNVADTGVLRAQEIAGAQDRLGTAIATGRGQDISIETVKGAQGLDAARANQAANLQTALANAGWSNEAILKMSDQEMQARLANAGFTLTQEQMDDVRARAHVDQVLQANRDTLAGSQAAAGSAEERRARLAQLQQMQADAKARGDAATEQMIGTVIASYLQYG